MFSKSLSNLKQKLQLDWTLNVMGRGKHYRYMNGIAELFGSTAYNLLSMSQLIPIHILKIGNVYAHIYICWVFIIKLKSNKPH